MFDNILQTKTFVTLRTDLHPIQTIKVAIFA